MWVMFFRQIDMFTVTEELSFEVIKCYIFNSWKHLQEAACIIGKEKLRLVKGNLLQN